MRDTGRLTILCSAKVNLYLEVIGKRPDGFHDILTFLHPISLYDRIELERAGSGISLSGSDPGIPWDETNLCWLAASMIMAKAGPDAGVKIKVEKRIPAGAGLGGGSSDAAAVLYGINRLFGLGIDQVESAGMAAEIGSDVPFFLGGSPAIGTGRGEVLEPVDRIRGRWIVVAKPAVSVSTGQAYQNLKLVLTTNRGKDRLKHLLKGLNDFPGGTLNTYNSFEGPAVRKYPEIGALLKMFKDQGAELSSLSGSGAACFALFGDEGRASEVKDLLIGRGFFAEITQPVGQTFRLLDVD